MVIAGLREVKKTKLKNVLLFKPLIFEDFRGEYVETFNKKKYTQQIFEKTGEKVEFLTDDFSISSQNVLRGIHGDNKTWKLISCGFGKIYAVIVNCNDRNEDFGKWQAFDLSEKNRHQILIPPMHGTSHLVLTDRAMFQYKQSEYYDPENLKQFTYRYDDPRFKIWWPIKNPILSERDEERLIL